MSPVSHTTIHQRRHDRMNAEIRRVCDAVGDFIEYWGFKAIHGKIWTILALRRDPMAQTEIAEFLGVSRSLVNGAVRELVGYGLVEAISEHRNSPYRAVVDIWPTIADILRQREWALIDNAKMAIESAIEEVEFGRIEELYDLSRLRFLLRLTELAQAFLRSLIGIRTAHRRDSLGEWMKRCGQFMRDLRTTH